ncbi:MAG: 50S ribosomal protein L11 [Candidatus Blackburnbacteria bacterium]|nr:50S ribosomal protein L11 [Candidatus Blackburnbacteria bacterium]
MVAKKVKIIVKINLPAGEATPAPPLGPTLGQHGVPIMDFVKAYNEKTADQKGNIVPVVITIYEDRSFEFETKLAPVSELIKKELNLQKGSGEQKKNIVGKLTSDQIKKIAEAKLPDLNTVDVEAAMHIVEGTARSMGVKVSS